MRTRRLTNAEKQFMKDWEATWTLVGIAVKVNDTVRMVVSKAQASAELRGQAVSDALKAVEMAEDSNAQLALAQQTLLASLKNLRAMTAERDELVEKLATIKRALA